MVNDAQKERVVKIVYTACSRHYGLKKLQMLNFILILQQIDDILSMQDWVSIINNIFSKIELSSEIDL